MPQHVYQEREQPMMKPYIVVDLPSEQSQRKADKTGLISFRANKYSVPQSYQHSTVTVEAAEDRLLLFDALEATEIASHTIVLGKGPIIKNTDHYRDHQARIADYETILRGLAGEDAGRQLCQLIKPTSPKIYKDQLAGAIQVLAKQDSIDARLMVRIIARPRLTATQLRTMWKPLNGILRP